jgi:hypothetical protein
MAWAAFAGQCSPLNSAMAFDAANDRINQRRGTGFIAIGPFAQVRHVSAAASQHQQKSGRQPHRPPRGELWDGQDDDERKNRGDGPGFRLVQRDQYCLMLPAASRSPLGLYPDSCRFLT